MKESLLVCVLAIACCMPVYASNQAYVSFQGGIGGMDTSSVTLDADPYTSYSLRSGAAFRPSLGYLFDLGSGVNIGLEAGYAAYPDNKYQYYYNQSQTYSGHYYDILGVGKLHFNSNETGLYALLKLGTAIVTQKYESGDAGFTYYREITTVGAYPELSLGLGYDLKNNLGIDASWTRVFADQANPESYYDSNEISTVTTLMVGVNYRFSLS
jgi:hypothetical protein